MGRAIITDSSLLAICEIKAYPDPWHMRAGPSFRSDLAKQMKQAQMEACGDARRQAALYLSAHKDISGVVVIASFGAFYSWRNVLRDAVTDVSSNTDPSWRPSDQPSKDLDEATNRVEIDVMQGLHVAGSSNTRPKRQLKQVGCYQQYQKNKQLYLTTSEESDSCPADRKGKGKARGKAGGRVDDADETKATKGTSSVKKKGKKKGKAKSVEKPKPLQKPETVNEPEPMALMPFLLELPPPLPVELRNQVPAAHTPGVATSTAGTRSAAADSSSPSGNVASTSNEQPESEDRGEQREEIKHVPDDEQDWSAWYHWDSVDGRRERVRMLNAIQRWNPNRSFLKQA
ncbi:hypothetical protein DAEQUDRAFT_815007 [Daedalea quercina L-15889]|uniref:Uncharacterized protein n=1 Tax=Daedalea quercina L-15889 TaxID=1314783 RepID=A0A165LGD9_9APHY|nr:hypothetical protein DAEQUDRAFT_815007 [Daedalea quercina L-15889]